MLNKSTRLFITSILLIVAVAASISAQEVTRLGTSWIALANIFQSEHGYSVWRWHTELEQGIFQFHVDYDAVEDAKTEAADTGANVLIDGSEDIAFWALSTGECLIVSPTVDGTLYEFSFEC